MADIRIAKPAAGVAENVPSEPGARFVFEFPTTDATLLRDGDNLVINFPDGSQISLQDFYTEYDGENLPSFAMEGMEVTAQDFFTAMNEPDLMPAAGPGTGADAADNARYHAYDDMALAQGIDHLWQLDWNMQRGFDHDDEFNSWGRRDDLDGQESAVNTLVARADIPEPGTPDRDAPSHDLPDLRPETPVDRPVYEPIHRPEPTPPTDHNPPYEPVVPPTTPPDAHEPPYEPGVPPTTPPPGDTPPPPPGDDTPPPTEDEEKPGPDPDPAPDIDPGPTDPDPIDPKDPDPDLPPNSVNPPADPDNPPKDPDPNDPDHPYNPRPIDPTADASQIIVDEAAWALDKSSPEDLYPGGGETVHGFKGPGHVTANLQGKPGFITIAQGTEQEVVIEIYENEAGKLEWRFPEDKNAGNTYHVITPAGSPVEVTITGASYNEDNHTWNVNFQYILKGGVEHTEHQGDTADSTNLSDVASLPKIPVIAEIHPDIAGGGKPTDPAYITIEIHDDGPRIGVIHQGEGETFTSQSGAKAEVNLTGSFKATHGADDAHAEKALVLVVDGQEIQATGKSEESWVFDLDSGKLTISHGKGLEYKYVFEPNTREQTLTENFKVRFYDTDNDFANSELPITINYKPEVPENPRTPEDPNDPNNPEHSTNRPDASTTHIVVDEAAKANASGSGDTDHGFYDQGSFNVQIHGGESGHIVVGQGDNLLVIKVPANGEGPAEFFKAAKDAEGNYIKDANGNYTAGDPVGDSAGLVLIGNQHGVDVFINTSDADAVRGDPSGKWTIKYDYKLAGAQKHGTPDSVGTDDILVSPELEDDAAPIKITVVDQTGDPAYGRITVEVHDDGPVVSAYDDQTAKFTFGADNKAYEGVESPEALTFVATVKVGDKDVTLNWVKAGATGDGESNLSGMGSGEWTATFTDDAGKSHTIKMTAGQTEGKKGQYWFTTDEEDYKVDINLKAVDADLDTDMGTLTVSKPAITPTPDPDPDPENPPVDPKPGAPVYKIEVDEGDRPYNDHEGEHRYTEQNPGHGSFDAHINGETGTIVVGDADGAHYTITIAETEGGEKYVESVIAEGGAKENGIIVNGVKVTIDEYDSAKEVSESPVTANGEDWTINFNYALHERQDHDPAKGQDNVISADKAITITVTDKSGDTASGHISVDLHDDIPEVEIVEKNVAKYDFGADNYKTGGLVTPVLEVFLNKDDAGELSNKIEWITGEGKETNSDLSQMKEGDKWSMTLANGKTLTVESLGENKFNFESEGQDFKQDLHLKVVDSDNDTDITTLSFSKPLVTHTPKDPDNPPKPEEGDPDATVARVEMDEGYRPQHGAGVDHRVDTSFDVHLNGEKGKILVGETDENGELVNGYVITIGGDGNKVESIVAVGENVAEHGIVQNGIAIKIDTTIDANAETGTNSAALSYNAETKSWTVNYEAERTSDSEQHTKNDDPAKDHDDKLHHDIKITAIDESGDKATGQIHVELHDDAPEITVGDVVSSKVADAVTQTVLNFGDYKDFTNPDLNAGMNVDKTGYSKIELNNIQCIASNVRYAYADGKLIVEEVYDENGASLIDRNDNEHKTGNYDKKLSLADDGAGLGVGNYWDNSDKDNAGDMSLKPGDSTLAEAVVLEDKSNSVSYGMILEFGHFDENDKALVTFMLTPRNNNDDTRVFVKEVSYKDLCDADGNFVGKVNIPVPDGYTKTFVSALPGQDSTNSAFTIKTVEMTRPAYDHKGSFDIDYGADGDKIVVDEDGNEKGSFTFEIDKSDFADGVEIKDSLGNADYNVELKTNADGSVSAILQPKDGVDYGDISLAGKPLFTLDVNQDDGSWSVRQFYNFSVKNTENHTFDIKFSVTDKDGDVDTKEVTIDPNLPIHLDRFQNVETGTYKDEWKTDSTQDNEADLIYGKTGLNNLMYGKGGNDVMFGDGDAATAKALLKALGLDENLDIEADMQKILNTLATGHNWNGNEVLQAINRLRPYYKEDGGKAIDDFVAAMEKAEKQDGGDDALFGGLGDDILFGGAGDDYLNGNGLNKKDQNDNNKLYLDKDAIFGGSGNDIIVYDSNDWVIHGGSGIDVLLAGKGTESLGELLGENPSGAYVGGIEVLIKTEDTTRVENLGITSHDALHNYGIFISADKIDISAEWKESANQVDGFVKYEREIDGAGKVTVEIRKDDGKYEINHNSAVTQPETEGTPLPGDGFAVTVPGDGAATLAVDDAETPEDQPTDHILFGDGADRQGEITEEIATEMFGKIMSMDADENRAFGERIEGKNSIEADSDNNDVITGGMGNELIFGMGGDDYIDGGEGIDNIFAGSGNDIIRYDENDIAINGGSGIDLIIAGKDSPSLEKLLDGPGDEDSVPQPIVNNVELMLKGSDKESEEELNNIRNLADVAALGIVVSGNEIVVDTSRWEQIVQDNPSGKTVTFEGKTESGHKMILEVAKEGDHKLTTATNGDSDDNILNGDDLANIMHGMDGDDQLFGGLGDDKLFGDKGDDFIDGGEGRDWIEGGEGNDIILLDPSDYLIDGGDEIDFILSTDKNASLAQMLENGANPDATTETPMVRDVEVLVSGKVDDIKSVNDLADKGINLDETKTGISLSKDKGWKKYEDTRADDAKSGQDDKSSSTTTHKYYNEEYDLVVETTVPVDDEGFDTYMPPVAEISTGTMASATGTSSANLVPADADDNGNKVETRPADSKTDIVISEDHNSENSKSDTVLTDEVSKPEDKDDEPRTEDDADKSVVNQDSNQDDGKSDTDADSDSKGENQGNVGGTLADNTDAGSEESGKPVGSEPVNKEKPVIEEVKTEDPADKLLAGKDDVDTPIKMPEPQDKASKDDYGKDMKDDAGKETIKTASTDTLRDSKADSSESASNKDAEKSPATERASSKGSDSDTGSLPSTAGRAEADIMADHSADSSIMDQIAAATNQVLADSGNGLG